ncbi:MAG: helix-turn-helix domain-containing protein [Cellulosilyticaceae bacterium]
MAKRISAAKEMQIINLYLQGVSYEEISKTVDVGVITINKYIKKYTEKNTRKYTENNENLPNKNKDQTNNIIEENKKLKRENEKLYKALDYADDKILTYKEGLERLRQPSSEIIVDSIDCSKLLMSRFPICNRKQIESLNKDTEIPNFGGILTPLNIRTEGGLYLALASVLSLYYDAEERIKKIDRFLDEYSVLQLHTLKEIDGSFVKKVMDEFINITT